MKIENIQKGYDDRFDEGKEIESLQMDTLIGYNRFKGQMFVSGRDFVFVSQKMKFPNGKIIVGASSVEHPKCPPLKSSVVRAEIEIAGWIFEP